MNERNGWVPRDFWLEDWEKQPIIGFHLKNPLEGYRRLTFMMLDAAFVTVSPSSVWRVLGQAGLLSEDARRLVQGYVEHYNNVLLNSAVGYITPKDMLAGRQPEIYGRERPEVGAGPKTASDSSQASRLTPTDRTLLGVGAPRTESQLKDSALRNQPSYWIEIKSPAGDGEPL